MKSSALLILAARRLTNNEDSSATTGITDDEILQYLNDAQDRIQGLISNQKNTSKIFTSSKVISSISGIDGIPINDRIFYNKEIQQVEFSYSGNDSDYTLLTKLNFFNRDTSSSDYAEGYYTAFGKIYLVPIITNASAKLRIMFERSLDDLDKSRGTVSLVTGLTSTTFTSITIGSDADETSTPNLSTIDFICVNDAYGNVKAYNIPVGTYTPATNVLTPAASFSFQSGETIAIGDKITFGKYSTLYSKLPDEIERYLVHYAARELSRKDSKALYSAQAGVVSDIETDIVKKAGSQTAEVQFIPRLGEEWW